jgi:protein gp37
VWAGTSITNRATEGRLDSLANLRAKVRFASLEPLRESINLELRLVMKSIRLDLVIVGGESSQGHWPAHHFTTDLAEDLIRTCRQLKIAVFIKQLGSNVGYGAQDIGNGPMRLMPRLRDSHGGDWSEWPENIRVREMPRVSEGGLFR